jgi:UDP-glucose 4-epimerase
MNTTFGSKKILIRGGAGFIGSHLAEYFIGQGCWVTIIDNLSTGSIDNIKHLKGNNNLRFINDTILNKQGLGILVENCDEIYHLAAAVGVRLIIEDPVHTIETNVGGTDNILKLAAEFGKPVFIASTSEVYGKNSSIPFKEQDDTLLGATIYPRWSYAASKAIDEFLALAYHKQFGVDVVIGRFFNTIGTRQTGKYGMVVPRFIKAAKANEPLEIYGSGEQTRCFCDVGDVVKSTAGLMQNRQCFGQVFNIGSTEEISISRLADLIIDITKSKSKKVFISYDQAYGKNFDDMQRRVPCVDKLYDAIGFKPATSLKDTLTAIIKK